MLEASLSNFVNIVYNKMEQGAELGTEYWVHVGIGNASFHSNFWAYMWERAFYGSLLLQVGYKGKTWSTNLWAGNTALLTSTCTQSICYIPKMHGCVTPPQYDGYFKEHVVGKFNVSLATVTSETTELF